MKINRRNTNKNIRIYKLIDTGQMSEGIINDHKITRTDVEEINKYLHNNLNHCLTKMLYLLVERTNKHYKRYHYLKKNKKYESIAYAFNDNLLNYICPSLLINFKKTKNKNEIKLNISVFSYKTPVTIRKPLKKINPVYIPNIILKNIPEALQKIGIYTAIIPYIEKILQENAEKYLNILTYVYYNADTIIRLFNIDNTHSCSQNSNIKMSKGHTKQIRIILHNLKTIQYVRRKINA